MNNNKMESTARRRLLSFAALALVMFGAAPGEAACLLKPRTVGGHFTVYTIMAAPSREVASYTSAGFFVVKCPVAMQGYADLADRICSAGPVGRAKAPYDAQSLIGRPREQACASIRAGLAEGS